MFEGIFIWPLHLIDAIAKYRILGSNTCLLHLWRHCSHTLQHLVMRNLKSVWFGYSASVRAFHPPVFERFLVLKSHQNVWAFPISPTWQWVAFFFGERRFSMIYFFTRVSLFFTATLPPSAVWFLFWEASSTLSSRLRVLLPAHFIIDDGFQAITPFPCRVLDGWTNVWGY